jgi:hypothetical protein
MDRGPFDARTDAPPPVGRFGRLTRLYLATAALVAVVSVGWSELSNDPACTERPCRQDAPLMLGTGMEVMLLLLYLAGLVALRRSERRRDHPPEH